MYINQISSNTIFDITKNNIFLVNNKNLQYGKTGYVNIFFIEIPTIEDKHSKILLKNKYPFIDVWMVQVIQEQPNV